MRIARARADRTRGAGAVAAALFALVLVVLSSSLIGGRVLTSGDNIFSWPPFSAERPAGFVRASNPVLTDPVLGFDPDMLQSRADLRAGILPLWNPYVAAGRPLLGSQLPATVFPLTWLAFVFPFFPALGWIAAAKLLLAAAGMYLFCRELGLRRGPSLLGGIAFAFSMYFVTWLEHTETNVWLVLPWLFLFARRVCLSGSLAATSLLGASVGLTVLGGHPESSAFTLGAAAVYAVFELVMARSTGRRWIGAPVGLVVGAFVLGVGLGAIVAGPLLELLAQSGTNNRGQAGMPLKAAYSFFFPELWGRPDKLFSGTGPASFQERTAYFGALPLLLAIGGLCVRRGREQWFFAAIGAVVLAVVLDVPLIASGVRKLPYANVPDLNRLLILVVFAAAVLAASGLQSWINATPRERRLMLAVMATLAGLPPVLWALKNTGLLSHLGSAIGQLPTVHQHEGSADVVALASVWRWTLVCGLGLGGLWLAGRRRSALAAIAVVTILTGIDLATLDRGYHPEVPIALANPPIPAAIRYLTAHEGDGRILASQFGLPANLASRYRLRDARVGSDLPFPLRYKLLWTGLGGVGGDQEFFEASGPDSQRLADVFAVRYVLLTPAEAVPGWLQPVMRTPGGTVAFNPTALPRAWVAYNWRPARGRADALAATLASSTAALRDRPVIEGSPSPPGGEAPHVTAAHVVYDGAERVTVDAVARSPGFLVLDDSAYPGWDASVDGKPTVWRPANDNFRAVAIPAGPHRVSFRYRPASGRLGAIVSGFCLLALVILGIVGARRRNRRSAATPPTASA
jgi:Bacterial membrane protein YfhO